jgi:hypothetical protein
MKKIVLVLVFLLPFLCRAQAVSLDVAKSRMHGTWIALGDSICEITITPDSITTFRFRLNGVSRCTYKLYTSPCDKLLKFPAATGVYMVEQYKDKTLCCAIAELTDTHIKIIYPDGTEMRFKQEPPSK